MDVAAAGTLGGLTAEDVIRIPETFNSYTEQHTIALVGWDDSNLAVNRGIFSTFFAQRFHINLKRCQ
jgi:hypothetical protein